MKKIQEADILQDLAPQAKNVVKFQRDAAIKASLKAAKASTGILTPARKAAKEKAKLAKAVAQKLQQAGVNPTDPEIMKIAGLESTQITKPEVDEEAQSAITTGNIGSPTMATGEPAPFGSSHIFAPKVGPMISRRGDIKKKKNRKRVREFSEFYFGETEEKVPYEKQIQIQLRKAEQEKNAEKVVYYSQAFGKSAVVSFDRFKGSWAYDEWKKKNQNEIEKVEQEFKRFSWR